MENFFVAVNAVMPMFLFMLLGYCVKRLKIADEEFLKKLNDFCFKVMFPVLIFANVYKAELSQSVNPTLLVYSVAFILIIAAAASIVVSKVIKENPVKGVLIQAIFRSNFTLFGLSLGASVYGSENLGPMAVAVVVIVPVFNVIAVVVLEMFRESEMDIKRILKGIVTNPLICGAFFGIIVNISGINFPQFIQITISEMQAAVLPIALIVLGGTLKFSSISKNMKYLVPGAVLRLLIVPSIAIAGGLLLGIRGIDLFSVYVMSGTPVAVASYAMSQSMGGDYELAGQFIAITTIFSVFTMFGFILVLKNAGLI